MMLLTSFKIKTSWDLLKIWDVKTENRKHCKRYIDMSIVKKLFSYHLHMYLCSTKREAANRVGFTWLMWDKFCNWHYILLQSILIWSQHIMSFLIVSEKRMQIPHSEKKWQIQRCSLCQTVPDYVSFLMWDSSCWNLGHWLVGWKASFIQKKKTLIWSVTLKAKVYAHIW